MYDFQSQIFRFASHWTLVNSLVVLGVGLLYAFHGFRFARCLIPLSGAAGAFLLGGFFSPLIGVEELYGGGSLALIAFVLGLARFRIGVSIAATVTGAALVGYMASQLGLRPHLIPYSIGLGACLGLAMIWSCYRALPVVLTTLHGSVLMVVAFVGITSNAAPSLGQTFISWATDLSLMVPMFIAMLCVMGYSIQANARQGDITSGGSRAVNELENS